MANRCFSRTMGLVMAAPIILALAVQPTTASQTELVVIVTPYIVKSNDNNAAGQEFGTSLARKEIKAGQSQMRALNAPSRPSASFPR